METEAALPLSGKKIGIFGKGGSGKSTCVVLLASAQRTEAMTSVFSMPIQRILEFRKHWVLTRLLKVSSITLVEWYSGEEWLLARSMIQHRWKARSLA